MFERHPLSPFTFLLAFFLFILAFWSGMYFSVVLAGAAAVLFASGMLLGLELYAAYKLKRLKRDSYRRLNAPRLL